LNTEGPARNDTDDANTAAENNLCLRKPERPSAERPIGWRGGSVLLLRLRARPSRGQRHRAGPQTVQHRRRPRIGRDLLGPPGILPTDEGIAAAFRILGLENVKVHPPRFGRGWPSPAAIEKAYRLQALKHHPDAGGDPHEFRKVQWAIEVLRRYRPPDSW